MDRRLHDVVGSDVVVAGQRQTGRLHGDSGTFATAVRTHIGKTPTSITIPYIYAQQTIINKTNSRRLSRFSFFHLFSMVRRPRTDCHQINHCLKLENQFYLIAHDHSLTLCRENRITLLDRDAGSREDTVGREKKKLLCKNHTSVLEYLGKQIIKFKGDILPGLDDPVGCRMQVLGGPSSACQVSRDFFFGLQDNGVGSCGGIALKKSFTCA